MSESLEQLDQLNSLAASLYQKGQYEEAMKYALQAVDLARQTDEWHPEFAISLNNLAMLYYKIGDYAAVAPLCKQVLEIWRVVSGERHPEFAIILNNVATLYKAMGDYPAAEPLYKQALEIWCKDPLCEWDRNFAATLNNLALLYMAMGDYAAAEPLYKQALEISYVVVGEQHPDFATNLNNLAELYHKKGDYATAEWFHRKILEIRRDALGEQHSDFAVSLQNLAGLYVAMGDYAAAEPLYEQALEIWRGDSLEDKLNFAAALDGLSELYYFIGNYAAAEPLCKQALEIRRNVLGKQHPDFALSLHNLAELCRRTGNYVDAEPLFEQVLEIQRKSKQRPQFAISLSNLALLYRSMGDYVAAESSSKQVLEIQREVVGEQHPDFAVSLSNLAMLYSAMGNYAAAEPLYKQALEIWRVVAGEQHPDFALNLHRLAGLFAATNREAEALKMQEQALAIDDRMIGQVFSISSENQRTVYLATISYRLDIFLSLVTQSPSTSPEAVRSALSLVLRRKAVEAEVLAMQRDAVLGGKYPEVVPKLREITTLRAQIAQKTLAGAGNESLQTYQQLLAEWNARKERLEAEVARQVPEMNLERKLRSIDYQVVAMALPIDTMLVEFVWFDVYDFKAVPARKEPRWKPARYLAFVLPAGEPDDVQMLDLGEAKPIDQMIATFREAVSEIPERGLGKAHQQSKPAAPVPAQTVTPDGVGVALRRAVFDPLLPFLGPSTRLLVSPDGDLARLPLEVLPTDDGRYLLDQYRISYLSAGRDVLRFGAAASGQPAAPMVVADPDFDLGAKGVQPQANAAVARGRRSRDLDLKEMHFGRLAGTQVEGTRLAQRLGVQPVLAGQALEQLVKECRSPRILHLATHGFFLPDQPRDPNEDRLSAFGWDGAKSGTRMENPLLRSGLALAGANWKNQGFVPPPAAEDGLLTAEDVSGLDLLATDLVVLSACETGLGEIHVGEGVFGLRRAFVLAGAKTLVMSLWSVPDLATAVLMERFYDNLLDRKMPRYEALREAQTYTRGVTLGEIRAAWLTPEMIDQLAAGNPDTRQALWNLARQPDAHRPFEHPCYWGAFICQGEPDPLRGQ